jgi:hypothetical protein
MTKKIGLIAGSGQFPIIFSKKAVADGFSVYAAAFINEAEEVLIEHVEAIEWMHLGQIKRLIGFFKKNGVKEAVMLGAIKKTKMFSDIRPDIKAISLLTRMKSTHDDGLLTAFAELLEKEGIIIKSSTFLLPDLIADEGCWTKRKPTRAEKADIDLGWHIAKEIGRLDVGQCVVVRDGTVLAVEAIDGTDATIKRGGSIGKGEAVMVKVCKPNQDTRFDMPAVGVETIKTMHESGVKLLAIEARKAVVFDREEMVMLADRFDISVVAISGR